MARTVTIKTHSYITRDNLLAQFAYKFCKKTLVADGCQRGAVDHRVGHGANDERGSWANKIVARP